MATVRSGAPRDEVDDGKPVVMPGAHITLKVVDAELRRVFYTMRRTDTLHGLMDLYYASVSDVSYGSGTFCFDGDQVRGCQTPADLLMEDGDAIDFFPDMVGGGGVGHGRLRVCT